jgi:hypothetical protein
MIYKGEVYFVKNSRVEENRGVLLKEIELAKRNNPQKLRVVFVWQLK